MELVPRAIILDTLTHALSKGFNDEAADAAALPVDDRYAFHESKYRNRRVKVSITQCRCRH